MEKLPKITYYVILVGIIIFSFFNFSARFYPLLNSDYAVNILMAYKLNLPSDFYYWGQDRGGSLLPILVKILYKITSISPIICASIVHYIILIFGYFALLAFFEKRNTKLLLALVWFFPSWYYAPGFLQNFFGLQFSLMTMGLFCLKRMMDVDRNFSKGLFLIFALLIQVISLWVSDLSIVSIGLIMGFAAILFVRNNNKPFRALLQSFNLISIGLLIVFSVLAYIFISYAKAHATVVPMYAHLFNNAEEIGITIKVILKTLGNVFLFRAECYVVSIYAYLLVLGIPTAILLSKKSDTSKSKAKYTAFYFFLIFAVMNLIVAIISHWVFLNDVGRRYFVITYMSFAVAALLYFDLSTAKFKVLRMIILFVIVLSGSFSSIRYFYIPKRISPAYNSIKEFDKLGKAGIIADYWNSYINACVSPDLIVATPHDKSDVRNGYLIDEVLNQPKLYILKVYWMDNYPDTLVQFNRTLIKKGQEFPIAGMDACEYVVLK
ncbi:MAG: hypothetical protein K9J13_08785 [Saprospiraceae bacterium]|nr:hypothetical protein [Saprospiraceae bacterium]